MPLWTGEHSMRTVLGKTAGRVSLILVSAGMVVGTAMGLRDVLVSFAMVLTSSSSS